MFNIKGLAFGLLTAVTGFLGLVIPMYVAVMSKGSYSVQEVAVNIFTAVGGNAPIYGVTQAICVILLIVAIIGIILSVIGAFMSYKEHPSAKNVVFTGAALIMLETLAGMIIGFVSMSTYQYGAVPYGEFAFIGSLSFGIPFMRCSI